MQWRGRQATRPHTFSSTHPPKSADALRDLPGARYVEGPEGIGLSAVQSEVYEAFRAIDIPEEKALRAAAALTTAFSVHEASVASSFDKRDADISSIRLDVSALKVDLATVKGDGLLLKWMMSCVLAFQVMIFAKLFLH